MKVISQNLEFLFDAGVHVHSGKEWTYSGDFVQARVDHFADFFKSENADIVFLQELASEDLLKRIIATCGIDYSYFIAAPDQNGVGNAILLKAKDATFESIPSVASIPVFVTGDKDTIGPRLWARRDFIYVKTSYEGKPLYLLGIHLKSNFAMPEQSEDRVAVSMDTQVGFADGMIRSELFRASQAKKARETIDQFFKEDPEAQVVVAGDFNTQSSNPIFRIIQGGIKKFPDSLISTAKLIPEAKRYSVLAGEDKYLADHILLSKSLQPKIDSVEIRNENLGKGESTESRVESDHAAIVLELN